MARTYRITLKSPDGSGTLFTGTVAVEEIIEVPARHQPAPTGPPAGAARPLPSPRTEIEAPMTEPQRRYLFRLLGAQGLDPKEAETHLKTYFDVSSLRAITKSGASQLIEQMIADRDGNGAPDNGRDGRR